MGVTHYLLTSKLGVPTFLQAYNKLYTQRLPESPANIIIPDNSQLSNKYTFAKLRHKIVK